MSRWMSLQTVQMMMVTITATAANSGELVAICLVRTVQPACLSVRLSFSVTGAAAAAVATAVAGAAAASAAAASVAKSDDDRDNLSLVASASASLASSRRTVASV